VPRPPRETVPLSAPPMPEPVLNLSKDPDAGIELVWKAGSTVLSEEKVDPPDLAERVCATRNARRGSRPAGDARADRAVLHVANGAIASDVAFLAAAASSCKRPQMIGGEVRDVPAFWLTFAVY